MTPGMLTDILRVFQGRNTPSHYPTRATTTYLRDTMATPHTQDFFAPLVIDANPNGGRDITEEFRAPHDTLCGLSNAEICQGDRVRYVKFTTSPRLLVLSSAFKALGNSQERGIRGGGQSTGMTPSKVLAMLKSGWTFRGVSKVTLESFRRLRPHHVEVWTHQDLSRVDPDRVLHLEHFGLIRFTKP